MLKPVPVRCLLRRFGSSVLFLVLWSVVTAYAANVTLFTSAYDSANVRIEWEVNTEADVTGFDLSRKAATETSFTTVTSVVPTGQRRYQYLDTNVYRATATGGPATATAGGGPFTYRLTVRSPGGDVSYLTILAGTPSAVQRSWGTIKSMFR